MNMAGENMEVNAVVHVTPKDNPELKWDHSPARFAMVHELLKSDAYRSLTKLQSDLWLFALTERRFPGKKGKKKREIDYWHPDNHRKFILTHKSIQKYFSKTRIKPPSQPTVTHAITAFMRVGFLSIVKMGGNGLGDISIYRLEHNWRNWRLGDPPCFVRAGKSNSGFCSPKKIR
jgi:hypothetical protein